MSGGVPALSDLCPRRRRYNYRRPSDPLTASSPHGSRRHLDSQKRVISELCFGRRHFAAREKAVMINLTTFLSVDAKIVADTRKDQGPFFSQDARDNWYFGSSCEEPSVCYPRVLHAALLPLISFLTKTPIHFFFLSASSLLF